MPQSITVVVDQTDTISSLTSQLLAQACHVAGWQVLAGPYWLPDSFAVTIAAQPVQSHNSEVAIIASQNPGLIAAARPHLTEQSIVISEEIPANQSLYNPQTQLIPIAFNTIARQVHKKPVVEPVIVGCAMAALGLAPKLAKNLPNTPHIEAGYQATVIQLAPLKLPRLGNKNDGVWLSGQQATILGLLAAGTRYLAHVPTTAQAVNWLGADIPMVANQTTTAAQAVSQVMGAAIAGCRVAAFIDQDDMGSLLPTIQTAIEAEQPLVVVCQPIRDLWLQPSFSSLSSLLNEQGGLLLKPANQQQCYAMAQEAANIAEQLQTPVVISLDGPVAYSSQAVNNLQKIKLTPQRGQLLTYKQAITQTSFQSYKSTPNGLSPRKLPGQPGPTIKVLADHSLAAQTKRLTKMAANLNHPIYQLHGPIEADITVLCAGYIVGPATVAMTELKKQGLSLNILQVTVPYPPNSEQILPVIRGGRHMVVVEAAGGSSLATLLRQQTGLHLSHVLLSDRQPQIQAQDIINYCLDTFTHGGHSL